MRKVKLISLILFSLFFIISVNAQEFICPEVGPVIENRMEYRGYGMYKPAEGTLKVAVILAKTKNDMYDANNVNWPVSLNATPPVWTAQLYGLQGDVTQYFNEMSFGKLNLEFYLHDEVITSDYEFSHYLGNSPNLALLNQEILEKAAEQFDFTGFDEWTGNTPGSDGFVDMVIIMYRHIPVVGESFGYSAMAGLELPGVIDVGNGLKIMGGFSSNGSGIQVLRGINGREYQLYVTAHELGHYLLGGGHIENCANLVLMSASDKAHSSSYGMHSWERYTLGWIESWSDVTSNRWDYELGDYITTGDHVKLNSDAPNKYTLLEFHNKTSFHDRAGGKGLYIFEVSSGAQFPPLMTVKTAEGDYDFTAVFNQDPALTRIYRGEYNVNSGFSEMNYSVYDPATQKYYYCRTPEYPDDDVWGDAEDAWTPEYNNLYNVNSNPKPRLPMSHFNIHLKRFTDSSAIMDIRFGDIEVPVKPFGLKTVITRGNHPALSWLKYNGQIYYIYKKNTISGDYFYLDSVYNSDTYTDVTENIVCQGCLNEYYVKYKIRTGKVFSGGIYKSVFSDSTQILVQGELPDSPAGNNQMKDEGNKIHLSVYPNPFNPDARLTVNIAEDSEYKITVMNLLGEEVKQLHTGYLGKGKHEFQIEMGEFSSGVYFINMQGRSGLQIIKINLLK